MSVGPRAEVNKHGRTLAGNGKDDGLMDDNNSTRATAKKCDDRAISEVGDNKALGW